MTRQLAVDLIGIGGVVMLIAGCWMVSPWAALAAVGVMLLAVAVVLTLRG